MEVNEIKEFSKQEFAEFFLNELNMVKKYKFDAFYDIASIMRRIKETEKTDTFKNEMTETVFVVKFYWFLRETGTDYLDLESNSDELYDAYFNRNSIAYKIRIVINSDFLCKEKYATIERIK